MKIENEFIVGVPVERAWEVLTDLEGIAPCMPGAQLTGVEGETYSGKLKLKVGPVVSDFGGTASFVTKDDAEHRAVIDAKGRDARGSGNASASITATLRPDGERTVVSVETDLRISGKLAQFGNRMIGQVSEKLLKQFVTCLESQLLATPATGTGSAGDSPDTGTADAASGATEVTEVTETTKATDTAAAGSADVGASTMTAGGDGGDGGDGGSSGASADGSSAEGGEPVATEAKAARGLSAVPSEIGAATGETVTGEAAGEAAAGEASAGEAEQDRRHGLRAVQAEAEPVDLVKLAGGTVAKWLVPAIVVLIVLIVVIWLLVR